MGEVLLVGRGSPEVGGIASFLAGLESSSLRDNHTIRFLNLATPRGDAGRLTAGNLSRTLSDSLAVWRGSGKRSIVHVNSALSPTTTLLRAGALAAAARAHGAKVIIHAHGGRFPLWMTTPARRLAARAAFAPAHRIVAVSSGTQAAVAEAAGPERVVLIPNGIDTETFSPAASRADQDAIPRVLYAGYLTERKGLGELLEASDSLRDRGVAHELVLVGGSAPDSDPTTVRAVAERNDAGTVRALGAQPLEAMPDLYRSSDVYCLPSWWEAMPMSVLEAMASGLPVVASGVGDIPSIVTEGVSGRLVPPRDARALADALEGLLTDPALRRTMGSAARSRVERDFSAETTIAAIDALYRQLSP